MTAGRKIITSQKEWGTPKIYVDAVRKVFDGQICLDPCSNTHSIVDAEIEFILPTRDGLKEVWDYPKIYVNPPYGVDKLRGTRINDWLQKCASAYMDFNSEVQALIPVATNTGHWKRYVFGVADMICFLHDTRLKFLLNGQDNGTGAPMACAMVYYGKKYKKFARVFKKYGAVLNLQDLKNKSKK